MANECSDACRMTEIIERVHFPVCSRNPTREDPARLSSGNCDDNVQPFGGERRSRDQLVHRQGPSAPTQRNVHHSHGLLWNRKQPGHSKAAPRCRKYLIKFKFLRRAFACIWPSAFPTFQIPNKGAFVSDDEMIFLIFYSHSIPICLFLLPLLSYQLNKKRFPT
jgi:hypothetical protein